MSDPTLTRIGDAYVYEWPAPDFVQIEISDVHQKNGDWPAWITVRTTAPGVAPHLAEGKHNLSAIPSRTSLAKHLTSRMDHVDWTGLLEMACMLTVRSEREGDPFLTIGDMPDETEPPFVLAPTIRRAAAVTKFGDGGVLKSTLAVLEATLIAAGIDAHGFSPHITGPWLYLDWETDRGDLDDTAKKIARGLGIDPPPIFYRREVWPLHQTARQVKRFIDQEGIVGVTIDSVGAACGDDPERAEPVLRFYQAVRSLGVAANLIDHVTKSAENGGKPFGSAYKHNASRMTFEIRKHQLAGDDAVHVGIYARKANKGALLPPFGLAVTYTDDAITFRREDIKEPSLREGLSASQQIKLALGEAKQALTIADIADVTGLKETIARARTQDLVKAGVVVTIAISGAANKYALRSSREAE